MGVERNQLYRLKEPFKLKWRVKSLLPDNVNPTHMVIVGYIDARQVYERLDQVVRPENWQEDYFECKGKQFCKIGIKIGDEWIWKGDSGTETFADPSKGETSDSVKRAAVHWGINKEAYELGEITIKCKMDNGYPAPCDEAGNILKGDQILAECKRIASSKSELIFDKNVLPRTIYNATVKPEEKKQRRKKSEPKIIMP
ncbi:Rad52/Rad22 family DNA repair protein [Chryseobacterium aquifrigidense]|uniref:Rad52/22 family double-strand break repair protein n=1 Tax=Chryseobacterium aquifrigidense TaxID=558021 RepID=A0A543E9N0_9FLAO|nr:Rad52/Rad22 family DNA repair protein [Chryseobacterium aquifrigidense]TQM18295.1 hypothetical protein FB551_4076 [Chryseobacterium aquifrigidense]